MEHSDEIKCFLTKFCWNYQHKNDSLCMYYLFSVEQIKNVLKTDEHVHTLAQELYQQKSLLVMGRGYNYATCLEGALVRVIYPLYMHSQFTRDEKKNWYFNLNFFHDELELICYCFQKRLIVQSAFNMIIKVDSYMYASLDVYTSLCICVHTVVWIWSIM